MFVIVLLGGVGTTFGPVIGAFGIQLLESKVWGSFVRLQPDDPRRPSSWSSSSFCRDGVVAFARSRGGTLARLLGR